jgi:DNA-directed RNA polymerase subunit beta'
MGKAIYNAAFPQNYPFEDRQVTKKIVNGSINDVIKKYGEPATIKIYSKLEKIGFKFATLSGNSVTLDMLEIPDEIKELKKQIKGSSPEVVTKLEEQMTKLMKKNLEGTGLYNFLESGAGKGWGQPKQILIAKGMITDTKGNLLDPIEGSFADGLSTTEYFQASAGARKGMADRALNTADTGYFTRQLVYMLSPVEASNVGDKNYKDCLTKRTVSIKLTKDLIGRLEGRYHIKGGKIHLFNKQDFKVGDMIELRTPIYCVNKKICWTCYGELLKRHKTPFIGVMAGSKIGERGTQLIMRTFHTGGAATLANNDILADTLENDPLLNMNKVQLSAYMEQTDTILYTKKPVKITVDLSDYRTGDNIQYPDKGNSKWDGVWMNHLVAQVEFENLIFSMSLDYQVVMKGDSQKY